MFRWLNLTMRHIQVTLAHYQSARNLHHDACYMLIAHSHSWGDFSKIILLLIIKLFLRWLSWTMRHIQNILVAFPSARDLYCDFFQQISLNFCSRNIYNALQNILQQEQKVHVVCTVVCPGNWNNAQLDNLFNIKRTKIYSISMCYYPSPGVVVDHVLKL